MFTDLVGFTALTQANEQRALALLDAHYRLLRPIFPQHHGREIKTIGDSFLIEFESALDATNCAVEIQRLVQENNASVPEDMRFRIRIGVHLGDVVHTENDVLGDAINLASRIEPLAEPGGICVSEQIFAQVRNKVPYLFVKLADVELKNVTFPLEVYKVELPWEKVVRADARLPSGPARRLAVLPLANMSADPQDEFFADGLTEEMISELSKVPELRVIARTSVMRFRGTTKGISEIGNELRVGTIIEGSVRRAGNRIRVTAQLVDAGTEEHLWSEKYDRELVDVFAIQSEIAKEVASALNIALPAPPSARKRPPPNINAFKSYLRGRYLWNRRTDEGIRAALPCFEEALRLDPQFAEASSGIADCYSILVDRGAMPPIGGTLKAKAAAERAIQLDESNAEAHASLGLIHSRNFSWTEAEREYERAISLNPMYASAHQWYYMDLMARGRREKAAQELDKAEDADPLSPIILFHRAFFTWITGTDKEALAAWRRATEFSGYDFSSFYLLVFFLSKSMRAEALELANKLDPVGRPWFGEATAAMLHAVLGQREDAYRELRRITSAAKDHYIPAHGIAFAYGALGDADPFFEWLFRAADERARTPFEFVNLPIFQGLRSDPRFQSYLRHCSLVD